MAHQSVETIDTKGREGFRRISESAVRGPHTAIPAPPRDGDPQILRSMNGDRRKTKLAGSVLKLGATMTKTRLMHSM